LREIINVVRHSIGMKGIDLEIDLTEDLPRVHGDDRQLQQVFLNLINNAAAAMPEGGVLTIRTICRRRQKGGGSFGIRVGDCTRGHRITSSSPFSPPNRRAKAPGWGCSSVTGSSTSLAAPSCAKAKPTPPRTGRKARLHRGAAHPGGIPMAGRILIVDDEADMLLLLKRIISEESDHKVVTENDPQRALALFRKEPFDLVITDLKMPKMDGIRFWAP
jgi:hypothetical protein